MIGLRSGSDSPSITPAKVAGLVLSVWAQYFSATDSLFFYA